MIDKLKNKVNVKRKEVKNKRGMKMNVSAYARQNGISWSTAKKQLSGNTKR